MTLLAELYALWLIQSQRQTLSMKVLSFKAQDTLVNPKLLAAFEDQI